MGKFIQVLEKMGIDIVLEIVVVMGEKVFFVFFNVFEMFLILFLIKEFGVEFKVKEIEDENVRRIKQEILNLIFFVKESEKEEKIEQVFQDL